MSKNNMMNRVLPPNDADLGAFVRACIGNSSRIDCIDMTAEKYITSYSKCDMLERQVVLDAIEQAQLDGIQFAIGMIVEYMKSHSITEIQQLIASDSPNNNSAKHNNV
jgi:hypothetical protein